MRSPRPVPWADDRAAPRALAEALREGRADGPSEAQLARLIQNVTLALEPAATGPLETAQAAAAPGAIAVKLKLIGILVGVAVLLTAGLALWVTARANEPLSVPSVQQVQQPSQPEPPTACVPRSLTTERAQPRSSAAPAAPPVASDRASAARERRSRAARAAQPHPLESELELLSRARRALPGAPARALQLIEQHERDFAGSTFAQEREALAVEALLAAGRTRDAIARAATFRKRYPDSPYQRRIDARLPRP